MMKIKKQIKVHTEQFDDVIGHCQVKRKYFTIANNNLIYKRLREETDINELPYLGVTVDFGLGNVCLEENEMVSNPEAAKDIFKEVLNLTKDKKLSLDKNNL